MKLFFPLFLISVLLTACAGNPPAWWNPGNRYGTATETPANTAKPTPAARKVTRPVSTEETIDPLPDSSYEEEVLSPLPEEEDTPAQPVAVAEPAVEQGLPTPSVLE